MHNWEQCLLGDMFCICFSLSSMTNRFILQMMYCSLAIPVNLESLGHWLCNCWCLCVLLVLQRTTNCSVWFSEGIELICWDDGSATVQAPAYSTLHHTPFGKCGSLIVVVGNWLPSKAAWMSSWKVQFTLSALLWKTILSSIIRPPMTSAINFNGLHNQAVTLSCPSLYFTLLLVLVQASEEQFVLFWLRTNLCWLTLKCTGTTSHGHLAT